MACLPAMAALFFLYLKWKKGRINKIGNPALVQLLIKDYSPKRFVVKFLLIALSVALLVMALANPRKIESGGNVKRNGIDVMIALDVSKSMLARDIKPNRLERAKQLISKLIDLLPNDRIGLVLFAGKAYLQMPLTSDHAAAKMYLSTAGTETVPTQGTVLGAALKMCYAGFSPTEKKYRSIILISDGEDHDKEAVQISRALADEGVMVNTIGIGSPEGAVIEDAATGDTKKDTEGNTVITKLNEKALSSIATTTGGIYQRFTNTDEVGGAMESQLRTMGQRSFTETSVTGYRYYFQWLLGMVLLVLLAEFFMTEKKTVTKITAAVKKNAAAKVLPPVALVMLLPVFSFCQHSNVLLQQGNELYKQGKYGEAAGTYRKATDMEPGNATAQFNLGNALFRDNKKEESLQAYDAAIAAAKNNADKAAAWYNKGVVLQKNKLLPECVEAYKNALKLNPADEDARLNLQKALQEIKRQQPKDDKKKQSPKPQQPKPQPSKISKKEAEEKLRALLQKEKNLQDKLRKVDAQSPEKPEKDW